MNTIITLLLLAPWPVINQAIGINNDTIPSPLLPPINGSTPGIAHSKGRWSDAHTLAITFLAIILVIALFVFLTAHQWSRIERFLLAALTPIHLRAPEYDAIIEVQATNTGTSECMMAFAMASHPRLGGGTGTTAMTNAPASDNNDDTAEPVLDNNANETKQPDEYAVPLPSPSPSISSSCISVSTNEEEYLCAAHDHYFCSPLYDPRTLITIRNYLYDAPSSSGVGSVDSSPNSSIIGCDTTPSSTPPRGHRSLLMPLR